MSVVHTTVNGQILHENRGGVVSHFVSVPLGSVVMVRDTSGNTVYEAEYDPYGNVQSETGTNPSEFGYVGTLGYVKDSAFSLYVRARYLLTHLGRWLTKDPLWPSEPGFVYARCSPTASTDRTGEFPIAGFLCNHEEGTGGNCCRRDGPTYPCSKKCNDCAASAGFKNVAQYCSQMNDWKDLQPPSPSIKDLQCLKDNLARAKANAAKHCPTKDNDKCLHCMTSCYLAQMCGKGPALWTGWCKEMQDLTDCKKSGVFDPKDQDANKVGVDGSGRPCTQACQRFGAT